MGNGTIRGVFRAAIAGMVAAGASIGACTPRGPDGTLEAYAAALEAGDVPGAYALTDPAFQHHTSLEAYLEAYASDEARRVAAGQARDAASSHVLVAEPADGAGPAVRRGEGGWRVVPPTDVTVDLGTEADGASRPRPEPGRADPAAVLQAFVAKAREGDMADVLPLLAAPLRTRYDADRLAADRAAADGLPELLGAIEAALEAGRPRVVGDEASLPLGGGRTVRMVREDGRWYILSLH